MVSQASSYRFSPHPSFSPSLGLSARVGGRTRWTVLARAFLPSFLASDVSLIRPHRPSTKSCPGRLTLNLAHQADFLGLLLLVAGFALLLVPLTLAPTSSKGWQSAFVPACMVAGGLTLFAFGLWEWKRARHPLFPSYLLTHRSIIFGLLVCLLFNMAAAAIEVSSLSELFVLVGQDDGTQNFLFTWYLVAPDQSILSATRLAGLQMCVALILT